MPPYQCFWLGMEETSLTSDLKPIPRILSADTELGLANPSETGTGTEISVLMPSVL